MTLHYDSMQFWRGVAWCGVVWRDLSLGACPCLRVCLRPCLHSPTCACVPACVRVGMCKCVRACAHVCMCTCMCACVRACMHVCVHEEVQLCMRKAALCMLRRMLNSKQRVCRAHMPRTPGASVTGADELAAVMGHGHFKGAFGFGTRSMSVCIGIKHYKTMRFSILKVFFRGPGSDAPWIPYFFIFLQLSQLPNLRTLLDLSQKAEDEGCCPCGCALTWLYIVMALYSHGPM